MIDYYLDNMEQIIMDKDTKLTQELKYVLMSMIDAIREEVNNIDD